MANQHGYGKGKKEIRIIQSFRLGKNGLEIIFADKDASTKVDMTTGTKPCEFKMRPTVAIVKLERGSCCSSRDSPGGRLLNAFDPYHLSDIKPNRDLWPWLLSDLLKVKKGVDLTKHVIERDMIVETEVIEQLRRFRLLIHH